MKSFLGRLPFFKSMIPFVPPTLYAYLGLELTVECPWSTPLCTWFENSNSHFFTFQMIWWNCRKLFSRLNMLNIKHTLFPLTFSIANTATCAQMFVTIFANQVTGFLFKFCLNTVSSVFPLKIFCIWFLPSKVDFRTLKGCAHWEVSGYPLSIWPQVIIHVPGIIKI